VMDKVGENARRAAVLARQPARSPCLLAPYRKIVMSAM